MCYMCEPSDAETQGHTECPSERKAPPRIQHSAELYAWSGHGAAAILQNMLLKTLVASGCVLKAYRLKSKNYEATIAITVEGTLEEIAKAKELLR